MIIVGSPYGCKSSDRLHRKSSILSHSAAPPTRVEVSAHEEAQRGPG
jgi:hypothetical protein